MFSKGVAILGSTGSIGCNTLRVIESLAARQMRVVALAAGHNVERLADQVAAHLPELASVENENAAQELRTLLFERNVDLPRIVVGEDGLVEVATHPEADCVVSATVGAVGFVPTLRALEAGKRVALANKETLVMAGELMTRAAKTSGAELLPVDSEHNALHQCLRGEIRDEVKRIVLTASGGPFRTKNKSEMKGASVSEAMRHPTWSMGAKITIDSATLMNKGLEVIEAHWLFGFGPDEIDILVHPESVVHSMIELVDGSVIAQMGITDMRHAIQYALTYPQRDSCTLPALDLTAISSLHFEAPDLERFPCIALAYRALAAGGTLPAAMNAANEEAVNAFLDERICLTEIPAVIEAVMDSHSPKPVDTIETVLEVDRWARLAAGEEIGKIAKKAAGANSWQDLSFDAC
ncbi:MAG TPA: 1-deoxy-D-xylulose-5-phosphate reductoisomerase [Pyrinomonadaceae bacterium]|jgi:1-deoxy-D-xylulose-5-phosphate reductoisomerase|nr:1-deoxy-D-xylulose-5-phosphate reductoisomerase [Pyrinomonadaceae bacterium]